MLKELFTVYKILMLLACKIQNWSLHLKWDPFLNAHHYRIMVMSPTFVYYAIDTTMDLSYDLSIDKYSSYINLKIIAESINDNILGESNEINISCSNVENFKIAVLNGCIWTALTFRSKWVYDLYKVYDDNTLIAETEDPILELPHKITKNKLRKIIVEWYIKRDDSYVLWWLSNGFVKLPERGKSNYKISVIIPVYNAETFLTRTIDSILSSSMTDIEIILINDWSTDRSQNICNWYAKNYPCVKVLQQSNQWVSAARNNGVNIAKGNYIGFVDNDDIVHPLMYEVLYKACEKEKSDIAIASTVIRNDIRDKEICLGMPWKKENIIVYTYNEVMNNMHKKDNMYFVAVWNKIVKKEIVKKVRFPTKYPTNVVLYEDSAYTPTLYSNIDKFVLCKEAFYIRDKRKQKTVGTASTMHKQESTDDIRKSFIYAYCYPIYNRCEKNGELSDYVIFKRLIESYDKFKTPSTLLNYWNEKLKELINNQRLYENNLIMRDEHLKPIINKFKS